MHTIFRDLESLQSAYFKTFHESVDKKDTSRNNYLLRCKIKHIPQSNIMSKDEWDAMQSGDINLFDYTKDSESKSYPYEHIRQPFKLKEDEESYLMPKTKMTEEEAMQWFCDSDNFHQLFHKFMQQQKYVEKEINGKQFWTKSK